jgi:hypothetical protein
MAIVCRAEVNQAVGRPRHLVLALAACLAAAPALAQTDAAGIGLLVKPGQRVDVTDDSGHETRGKVQKLSGGMVSIVADGKVTDIPVDRIAQIARPGDTLANGALFGLAAGATVGLLASTAGSSGDCAGYDFAPCFGGASFIVGTTLVMGAIGTGIGVAVDALIRRPRVIYRRGARPQARVTPVIGRHVQGAVVTVSW